MDKRIKIVLGVIIFLGILSGVFLLFAKKPEPISTPKNIQASAEVKPLNPVGSQQRALNSPMDDLAQQSGLPTADAPKASAPSSSAVQDRKALVRSQWTQCKAKTLSANTNLLWSVQITEGIPVKGTYAKGNLDGDIAFPVNVIVKSDSSIADKIRSMLVVGKTAFLRGTCADVAKDGSVVLEAF